jgi:hypothetical protein
MTQVATYDLLPLRHDLADLVFRWLRVMPWLAQRSAVPGQSGKLKVRVPTGLALELLETC